MITMALCHKLQTMQKEITIEVANSCPKFDDSTKFKFESDIDSLPQCPHPASTEHRNVEQQK